MRERGRDGIKERERGRERENEGGRERERERKRERERQRVGIKVDRELLQRQESSSIISTRNVQLNV